MELENSHKSIVSQKREFLGQRGGFNASRWSKEFFLSLAFVLCLAFFIHYREVRVESLEVNTKAERDVLAQVRFEFPDAEATSLLKQESMRDVGKIYRLSEEFVVKRAEEVERNLLIDSEWRKELPFSTFEAMYAAKEAVRDALLISRFVDGRTWQKMKEVGFPLEGCFIFDLKKSASVPSFPLEVWEGIQKLAFFQNSARREEAQYIIDQYRNGEWNFYEDLTLQNAVRQSVKISIPLKRTKVEQGSHIINAGERVTPRHLDMMKAMKKALSEQQNLLTPLTALGSLIMALIFTLLGVLYLRLLHSDIWHSFQKVSLLATVAIITLALAKLTEYCVLNNIGAGANFFRFPLFVPFAAVLVTLLLGGTVALMSSGFLLIVLGITLSIEYDHFLVVNLSGALVAIFAARKTRRRKEVFEVLAKVWMAIIPVILAFHLFEDTLWNFHLLTDLIAPAIFVFVTAILVIGTLPILEAAFGIVTDMMLVEYVDPNHPLLRRLSVEAPGTYQHSVVVATISEEAALAIGANGLFCRVATLYHDIGKLVNPHYFTENQFAGLNVHQLLTPIESAQVIIAHVSEGVTLAEKYDLPQSFIDIICEHHGTTSVYCFYRAQLELMRGDCSRVDELKFRYKGPKPRSKESAIIMIGDSVEAAFRCLEEVGEKNVTELVDRLVAQKINDGQLDECLLTFEEIGTIKKAMIRTLLVIRHGRAKYPVKESVLLSHYEEIFVQRV